MSTPATQPPTGGMTYQPAQTTYQTYSWQQNMAMRRQTPLGACATCMLFFGFFLFVVGIINTVIGNTSWSHNNPMRIIGPILLAVGIVLLIVSISICLVVKKQMNQAGMTAQGSVIVSGQAPPGPIISGQQPPAAGYPPMGQVPAAGYGTYPTGQVPPLGMAPTYPMGQYPPAGPPPATGYAPSYPPPQGSMPSAPPTSDQAPPPSYDDAVKK